MPLTLFQLSITPSLLISVSVFFSFLLILILYFYSFVPLLYILTVILLLPRPFFQLLCIPVLFSSHITYLFQLGITCHVSVQSLSGILVRSRTNYRCRKNHQYWVKIMSASQNLSAFLTLESTSRYLLKSPETRWMLTHKFFMGVYKGA